jgi:drug/metabolite transporter (DMT)-like permease
VSSIPKPSRDQWLLVVWAVFILCDTLAQLGFKRAAGRLPREVFSPVWWSSAAGSLELWAAGALIVSAFLCWLRILRRSAVGVAFAATSITLVTVVIASAVWLGEALNFTQCLGALFIVVGIFLLRDIPAKDGA